MLISSKNTYTETSRIMFDQISQVYVLTELTHYTDHLISYSAILTSYLLISAPGCGDPEMKTCPQEGHGIKQGHSQCPPHRKVVRNKWQNGMHANQHHVARCKIHWCPGQHLYIETQRTAAPGSFLLGDRMSLIFRAISHTEPQPQPFPGTV